MKKTREFEQVGQSIILTENDNESFSVDIRLPTSKSATL